MNSIESPGIGSPVDAKAIDSHVGGCPSLSRTGEVKVDTGDHIGCGCIKLSTSAVTNGGVRSGIDCWKHSLINTIKNNQEDEEKIAMVTDFVMNSGGIEYSTKKMNEHKDKALQLLSGFNSSEAKKALEQLVVYTIERKN